jgi:hypothetical protein
LKFVIDPATLMAIKAESGIDDILDAQFEFSMVFEWIRMKFSEYHMYFEDVTKRNFLIKWKMRKKFRRAVSGKWDRMAFPLF